MSRGRSHNNRVGHGTMLPLLKCLLLWSVCFCDAKSWADIAAAKRPAPATSESNTDPTFTVPPKKQKLSQSPAGVYSTLPKGLQKYQIRHVYDGDTLTLADGQKVRLLGIDTPELKPVLQPFALEAKAFTQKYCTQNDCIYLQGEGTDRYGRLLSVVWVQLPNGNFLNVCEGLVADGLATVYHVSGDGRNTANPSKHMVKLQAQARRNQLGLWKNFEDRNMVVTKYGAAYHLPTCRHLARSRNTKILPASKALDQGLHPCRTCLGDD